MLVRNKKLNVSQLLALLLNSSHSNPLLPRRLPTVAQVAVLLPGHLKTAPLMWPTLGPFNHNRNHSRLEGRSFLLNTNNSDRSRSLNRNNH